jgi:hypothetical protein
MLAGFAGYERDSLERAAIGSPGASER